MDDAETALYVAAGHGHEAAVRLLIELGADVKSSSTAVHLII